MANRRIEEGHEDKVYNFKPFRVPKYRIKFDRAKRLSDIEGYVWYTPAIAHLWGQYTDYNWADLCRQVDTKLFWYKFDRPIFQGLTSAKDSAWNHTLWACEQAKWHKLSNFILDTVQLDTPKRLLYQYALQTLDVLDPLTVDVERVATPKTPRQQIHSFAVVTNTYQVAIDVTNRASFEIPKVRTFKPRKQDKTKANTVFSGADKDYPEVVKRVKSSVLQDDSDGPQ